MSKELEEIKSIVAIHFGALGFLNPSENEQILKDRDRVLNALTELQSIDNSNPSEALECLEKLKGMEISSMPFSDEYGTQEVDLNDIRKVGSQLNTDFREYTATIKQALLKAQEPKHYLKWENLEFKIENQEMFVLLNGSFYLLEYYTDGEEEFVMIKATHTKVFELLGECSDDKQFFNDLHLERVEE